MKLIIKLSFLLVLFSCAQSTKKQKENSKDVQTIKVKTWETNNNLLQPVSKDFVVNEPIVDSLNVVFYTKCVVFSFYSDSELDKMESEAEDPNKWEALYDDISYYANEASVFLNDRTEINIIKDKPFIRFIFTSGDTLTISREKSLENIFFFNPDSTLKQCDTYSFNKDLYSDY